MLPKIISFNKSVKAVCEEYSEAIDILKELGFENITSPGMLNTVGRVMTISKGASMKGVPMDRIADKFNQMGFEIEK